MKSNEFLWQKKAGKHKSTNEVLFHRLNLGMILDVTLALLCSCACILLITSHPESKVLFTVGQFADPCKHDSQCRHEDEEGLVRLTDAGRAQQLARDVFPKKAEKMQKITFTRCCYNDKDADVDERYNMSFSQFEFETGPRM